MAIDALKPLLDSGVLNESTKASINEAWEAKLVEARSEIRAEIRSEFADRYNHDKKVMVNALDKMVSETLESELVKIRKEKKAMVSERVQSLRGMRNLSKKFETFMTTRLSEELKEFRKDRQNHKSAQIKLENFVIKSLAEEITEFSTDKKDLIETKVKLIAQAGRKLNELKARFIARSSKLVQETVSKQLRKELTQLHEDIASAKKNSFGRKIFEAYASEFTATQLNENASMRKLNNIIKRKNVELTEAKKALTTRATLIESKDKQLKQVKDSAARKETLTELLGSLNKEKGIVMSQLLENVQTGNLRAAFDKYLPSVLNNSARTPRVLTEERITEATGNKTAKINDEETTNIIDMRRLAGLSK